MKRIKMMGLCLVAVFAMSVVASSVASAVTYEQPVFYGKATVGTEVKLPIGFTATVGEANLETSPAHSVVKCDPVGFPGSAVGEVTGSTKTAGNITTFQGCTLSGFKCESGPVGVNEGVIITKTLDGTLGQIATSGKIGIKLFPHTGTELAAFTCDGGATPVVVRTNGAGHGVIGELSGASGGSEVTKLGVKEAKFGTTMKLTFKSKALGSGLQAVQKFDTEAIENNLEASLKGAAFEKSSQAAVATIKAEGVSNLGATK